MHVKFFTFCLLIIGGLLMGACNGSNENGEPDGDAVVDVQPDTDNTTEQVEEDITTPQPFGSPCSSNEDCLEGVCFENLCTRQCSSYAMCPEEGYRCTDNGEGRALCLGTSFETGPGTAGTTCAIGGEADCAEDHLCFSKTPDDPYAYCTKECSSDRECPTGMLCKALIEGERSYCRPRGFCDACVIDDECCFAGDRCIADDLGSMFCSQQCSTDGNTCPIDSTCTNIGEGVFQCLPDYDGHRCKGDGELCSPCEVDHDCLAGGECIEDYYTHHKFCGVPCDDPSCPAPNEFFCNDNHQCRPRKGSCSMPSGGCLICENCEDFTDCASGYCLAFPDELHMVCGEDCSTDGKCDSVWAECYEITSGSTTMGHNCLPNPNIANCFQYTQCNDYCPGGPTGCELPFCQL